jgi:hypothetical protein
MLIEFLYLQHNVMLTRYYDVTNDTASQRTERGARVSLTFLLSEDTVLFCVPRVNLPYIVCFNFPIAMVSKRPASDSDRSSGSKKHRRSISLAVKMDVLLRLEASESSVTAGKAPNLPVSTVCTICASGD